MRRVLKRRARRARVQVGLPDESLTRFSGLIAVAELVERLDVIGRLVLQRVRPVIRRWSSSGRVLV